MKQVILFYIACALFVTGSLMVLSGGKNTVKPIEKAPEVAINYNDSCDHYFKLYMATSDAAWRLDWTAIDMLSVNGHNTKSVAFAIMSCRAKELWVKSDTAFANFKRVHALRIKELDSRIAKRESND